MTGLYHATQMALLTGRKVCPSCSTEKPLTDYAPRKDGRYEARCKECIRAVDRVRNPIRRPRKTPIIPKAIQAGYQVCNTCLVEKSFDQFRRDNQKKSGYESRCKQCHKNHWDALTEEEKEQERKQDRDSRLPRKAQINARDRARHNTPEHNAKRRGRSAIKKMTDPEYSNAVKQGYAQWRKNNPLYLREYNRRYKAQHKGIRSGRVDYKRILERDGMFCHICFNKPINPEDLCFDHVIPVSPRRGEPQGTHTEDNIKPAHRLCNSRKSNKRLEDMSSFERRGMD